MFACISTSWLLIKISAITPSYRTFIVAHIYWKEQSALSKWPGIDGPSSTFCVQFWVQCFMTQIMVENVCRPSAVIFFVLTTHDSIFWVFFNLHFFNSVWRCNKTVLFNAHVHENLISYFDDLGHRFWQMYRIRKIQWQSHYWGYL